jgi:hypothetical protein
MKKIIFVSMFGQLGNQMFIYAFGKMLEKKYGYTVIFETSYYNNSRHKIEIDEFNLSNFKVNNKLFYVNFKYIKYLQFLNSKLKKILLYFISNNIKNITFEKNVDLQNFNLNHNPSYNKNLINKVDSNFLFYGYWQSLNYFKEINEVVYKEFTLTNSNLKNFNFKKKPNITNNSVAIHLRGIDIEDKTKSKPSISFYVKSLKFFNEKLDDPYFVIFTDDIEYAYKVINKLEKNINFIMMNKYNLNAVEEFHFLSLFSNYILSKSTFSWWASFLSKNKKTILISNKWFRNGKITKDRLIKEMVIIKEE